MLNSYKATPQKVAFFYIFVVQNTLKMRNSFLPLLAFCISSTIFAQDSLLTGKKYLEDQFYANVTYNFLVNKPDLLVQKGLSLGFHSGFIKDIPVTPDGNLAFGIGIGYAYDKILSNLYYDQSNSLYTIDEPNVIRSKFESHSLEIPFEFRIRNSTATQYKFWRVYVGGKINYIFASKNVVQNSTQNYSLHAAANFNKIQFGPQISVGYSNWNLYSYYQINGFFKDATVNEAFDPNKLKGLKIGLQFYIF